MKNIFIAILVSTCLLMVTHSCKKKVVCSDYVAKINVAKATYTSDQSLVNCNAYKAALKAWLAQSTCVNADATANDTYATANNLLTCQ
jgi:hypothetical protein